MSLFKYLRKYRELLRGRLNKELTYKVNYNSNEIHDMGKPHENCKHDLMNNYRLVDKIKAMEMIESGKFNGCRYCMKEFDKG